MDNSEPDPEIRSIKRELHEMNAKLAGIRSRLQLLFLIYCLLPVLVAIGGGFYYFGGVGFVQRTYQDYFGGEINVEKHENPDATEATDEEKNTKTNTSEHKTTDSPDESSTESGEKRSNDPDWNPGGRETDQAERRQEGFEEKTPSQTD